MQERFQKLLQRFLEFWNKYTKKQRTIFLSIVGAVIVLLVILILILGRTKYMVIAEFEDTTMAANAVSTLAENGIKTRLGSDKLTVEIDEEAEVQAISAGCQQLCGVLSYRGLCGLLLHHAVCVGHAGFHGTGIYQG